MIRTRRSWITCCRWRYLNPCLTILERGLFLRRLLFFRKAVPRTQMHQTHLTGHWWHLCPPFTSTKLYPPPQTPIDRSLILRLRFSLTPGYHHPFSKAVQTFNAHKHALTDRAEFSVCIKTLESRILRHLLLWMGVRRIFLPSHFGLFSSLDSTTALGTLLDHVRCAWANNRFDVAVCLNIKDVYDSL